MKFLLFFLFTLAVCTKERFEDAATLTDELLHELEKRLNNLHKDFTSTEELLHDATKVRETKNTIIKTSESLEAGAVYLGSPELTTEHLCQNECRKNWTCNLAVFKEKDGDTSCYLFNCKKPSVCSFVEHDGFSISELPERDTIRKGSSEDDLELLAASKPKTTTVTSTISTTKQTTTVTTTTVQTEPPRREPVPLFSECKDHKDCAGSSTQCLAGYCVCQDSYHPQEGLCRPDCTKFQFECANEGQPLRYPQCVAIYDKCDGIEHCHDASDEENCVKESMPDSPTVQEPDRPYVENKNTQTFGHDDAPGVVDHRPIHPTVSHEKPDRNDDKSTERPWFYDQNMNGEASNPKPGKVPDRWDEASSKQHTSEEISDESQGSSDGDSKDSSSEKLKNHIETVLVSSSPKPAEPGSDGGDAENDDNNEKGDLPNETVKVIEVDENGSVLGVAVDESAVGDTGVAVLVQTNKGAVVALSLGLAITFLLLFFVGCRLRNVRKRLRRGRPMNSNEADYLINGMYL